MGHEPRTAMSFLWVPILLASASALPLSKEQTPSWVNICGGTYLYSEDKKNWDDAYGQCELYGSHLVQIDDIAENFCLLGYAQTMGFENYHWTSANDRGAEGVWRQYDGTFLSWTPWWSTGPGDQGHPNGGKAANCADIFLSEDTYAGQWSDEPCSTEFGYICERDF